MSGVSPGNWLEEVVSYAPTAHPPKKKNKHFLSALCLHAQITSLSIDLSWAPGSSDAAESLNDGDGVMLIPKVFIWVEIWWMQIL